MEPQLPEAAKPVAAPDVSIEDYWKAMVHFRSSKPEDHAKGRTLIQEAADMEYGPAQFYLGLCLQEGRHGFPMQPKKAVNWFRLCAERGNFFGMCYLGLCYMSGTGVSKDFKQAEKWEKAVLSADPKLGLPLPSSDPKRMAAGGLGQDSTLSGELPVDPYDQACATAYLVLGDIAAQAGQAAEAQESYLKAANMGPGGRAGLHQAAMKAAINYAFGTGIERDMKKASALLEQSKAMAQRSSAGQAHSMVVLGMHDDFAQADLEEDLSKATELQHLHVQYEIAGSFADPKSKSYNPQEAAKWFELAANGGDPSAMLSLALLYSGHQLGKTEPEKAFHWFRMASEKGKLLLGTSNLALCYFNGLGVTANPPKAKELFAANKDTQFICYLGTIGQCPKAPLDVAGELELLRLWAEKKKDPHAMYLLALRLANGWGVKADPKGALAWFNKAAKRSHGPSLVQLGLDSVSKSQTQDLLKRAKALMNAVECFRKAALAGDANGHAMLASLYMEGKGVHQSDSRAMDHFEACLALHPNHENALNSQAVIHQRAIAAALKAKNAPLVETHIQKMLACYRRADELGSAMAAFNLGCLAYTGALGGDKYQQAYLYFEKAASRGFAAARLKLGELHEKGEGVPVTLRDAAYHYRLGALQGDLPCLERLCNFYLQGKGVSRDADRACFWLERLHASGRYGASVNYADILLFKGDYAKAIEVLKAMLKSSDPYHKGYAHTRMSIVYNKGLGVEKNPAKAKVHFDKALAMDDSDALCTRAKELIKEDRAEAAVPLLRRAITYGARTGHTDSLHTLACLAMEGNGMQKNVALAFKYMREAAALGNAKAQYAMAASYLAKLEGAPGLEEALEFARRSEAGGDPNASALRIRLETLVQAK